MRCVCARARVCVCLCVCVCVLNIINVTCQHTHNVTLTNSEVYSSFSLLLFITTRGSVGIQHSFMTFLDVNKICKDDRVSGSTCIFIICIFSWQQREVSIT